MKLLPLALLALGGGTLYALYSTKPRFLGDKARVNDRAVVPLSVLTTGKNVPPEMAATIGANDRGVVQVTRTTKDTIEGPVVAMKLPDGREAPAPTLPIAFEFPRSSVTELTREGRPVTL